ncbi:MAG TPA: class I SAM-dependent methyltransferase [Acetobacteraceae bacterium]
MTEPEWRRLNRANWDERVPIHLHAPLHYDQTALQAWSTRLDPIAEAALGPVAGQRILHLQCHFGMDTLKLAQQGATVVGVDFSAPAIAAAQSLATALGLSDRTRFVEADVYDAPSVLPDQAAFDRVFVSWGALCWLPDMPAWSRVVAHFLKPGGWLALAEAHPAAYVFDDAAGSADGMPGWYAPYLARAPLHIDQQDDYADPDARLANSLTMEWLHPLADVITGLLDAGLRLDMLQEHDTIVWQMFACLVGDDRAGYHWPDKPWLPLSYSLRASKPA